MCCPLYAGTVQNREDMQGLFRQIGYSAIEIAKGGITKSGDCDTDVVFTDVETGEKYRIGYITQGVTERIKLERGKWYKVAGGGNLTLNPVNIRVE